MWVFVIKKELVIHLAHQEFHVSLFKLFLFYLLLILMWIYFMNPFSICNFYLYFTIFNFRQFFKTDTDCYLFYFYL